MKKLAIILAALLIITSVTGCSTSEAESAQDYWPTEGWRTSTPEEQGMDSTVLNQMIDYFNEEGLIMDSVVVVRNGYIVLENYWRLNNKDRKHECFSVTKSFTSALIGIALKEGYIESLDQKMLDFFPNRTIQNLDARKEKITLEHLLMMREGFERNEVMLAEIWNPLNLFDQTEGDNDFVQFILDRPMATEPGTRWNYSTGVAHLLSAIVHETTGEDVLDFAHEFLFNPLGIDEVDWAQDPQGLPFGGFGLSLTSRDMAKFGLLYLNNGMWDEEQIVPADYVAASVKTYSSVSTVEGYGYHWWTFPMLEAYGASGLAGQFIGVFPEIDAVVVFTGLLLGDYMVDHYHNVLSKYLLESSS